MSGLPQQPQTVLAALDRGASATPDAPALLAPDRAPVSYRELHGAVERLAQRLRALRLGRGDGIAVLLPEGPALCLALLGSMSVGIAVPLAWPQPEAELRRALARGLVSAVLTSAASAAAARVLADGETPIIELSEGSAGRLGDIQMSGKPLADPVPESAPGPEDVALILSSSGTTGRPKLVPRLHRNIVASCRLLIAARATTAADRCLCLAKASYSQGFNALAISILSGGSLISVPEPTPSAIIRLLVDHRPTYVSTTPALLRGLAVHFAARQAVLGCGLHAIHSTASALSPAERDELEGSFGVPVLNGYGLSEAPSIAGDRYPVLHRVPGSVGQPWSQVQIVGDDGALASDGSGEIAVRGDNVFPGYLEDLPANSAAFLPGGWFRTGDIGFLDSGGYLHLTGRLGEFINRGGEKIAPGEVDFVLASHPGVADVAAFAVPDGTLGEDVVAAVVLEPGATATARELRVWMLDRLAAYKVPRRIWFTACLPKTPTGKVRRGELSRRWLEEQA